MMQEITRTLLVCVGLLSVHVNMYVYCVCDWYEKDASCRRFSGWAAGCTAEEWWFYSQKEQEIFPFSKASTFTTRRTPSFI